MQDFFVLGKRSFEVLTKPVLVWKLKSIFWDRKTFFLCALFWHNSFGFEAPTLIEKTEVERDFAISRLSKDFRQSLLPCKEFGEATNWVWKECILKMG